MGAGDGLAVADNATANGDQNRPAERTARAARKQGAGQAEAYQKHEHLAIFHKDPMN
jgi:hypothetical protein